MVAVNDLNSCHRFKYSSLTLSHFSASRSGATRSMALHTDFKIILFILKGKKAQVGGT